MNTSDMLKDLGHVLVEAGRAGEALIAMPTMPFDVLVTDVNLPGMSGPELTRQALARKPGVGMVFAAGYGPDELDAAIRAVLDRARRARACRAQATGC